MLDPEPSDRRLRYLALHSRYIHKMQSFISTWAFRCKVSERLRKPRAVSWRLWSLILRCSNSKLVVSKLGVFRTMVISTETASSTLCVFCLERSMLCDMQRMKLLQKEEALRKNSPEVLQRTKSADTRASSFVYYIPQNNMWVICCLMCLYALDCSFAVVTNSVECRCSVKSGSPASPARRNRRRRGPVQECVSHDRLQRR